MSTRAEDVQRASYEAHETLVDWCRRIEYTIDEIKKAYPAEEDAVNIWKAIETLRSDVGLIKTIVLQNNPSPL